MLLPRSKLAHFLVVAIIASGHCQSYDSDYRIDYDDDHSSYEDASQPDYSKYYSVDAPASAPIIQAKSDSHSGFVAPIEFSSFFGPSNFEFGASSNQEVAKPAKQTNGFASPYEFQSGFTDFKAQNPFASKDYFEEAQKQQQNHENFEQKDDVEVKPGPSYVSHKTAAPTTAKSYNYASEVTDLNKDVDYSPYKNTKLDIEDDKPTFEEAKAPKYDFDYTQLNPSAPLLKHTAVDPKYLPQITAKAPHLAPYKKFSFQPVTSYAPAAQTNSYYKTVPNYEYSPSETVANLLTHQNCKKVFKEAPKKDSGEAMDCYVCKDEKSGANYEQCSYGSQPSPKNYYLETSKKFSQPGNAENLRYRRSASKEKDPYELVKAQSQKYYSKPKEFEAEYYQPKDFASEEYRFGPEYFKDEEKSSSELHAEELVKSGENCKKIQKDNKTCLVCKNEKTGGNYEQCAYTSKPNEKKYAYVRERTYDREPEASEETSVKESFGEKKLKPLSTHSLKPSESKSIDDYSVSEHFQESNNKNKNPAGDLDELYSISTDEEKPLESPHKDKHYFKHFPEHDKEESKLNEQQAELESYGYYGDDGEKTDVEEVLAEFAKKDRTKCKKSEKNGMTCYLCTDKKGMQHEECMYVSESQPQAKYASLHAAAKDPSNGESKAVKVEEAAAKRKRAPKKIVAAEPATSANEKVSKSVAAPKTRQFRRTKNIPVDKMVVAESEQETQTALPYQDEGEGGAFTDETKPVYSEKLGFSLPKYMLDKSEGEAIYDELAKMKS